MKSNKKLKCNKKYAQKESYDRYEYKKYDNRDEEMDWDCRNEFIRDRDRIVYTKAFRRLQHKAQVYSPGKGDHYRTRLTHTLEVSQIARGIARNLGLNEMLTEAIALGHDIGHTPFGHAGEEILDDIMRGDTDLGGKIKYRVDYGGFKHNLNSLNILECTEQKYEDELGLNLTWQVLDGILKHTKIIKQESDVFKKWDWKRFVKHPEFYENLIEYDFNEEIKYSKEDISLINSPLTLEGQVVNIADEIAQREHDLDDSFRNWINSRHDISMFKNMDLIISSINKRLKEENYCNKDDPYYKIFKKHFNKIRDNLGEIYKYENDHYDILSSDNKLSKLELDFYWKDIIRSLIIYFKEDVTKNTKSKINKNIFTKKTHKIMIDGKLEDYEIECVNKKIVYFSEIGEIVNEQIEKFLENRLINSYEVARFDGKGKFIIRQLFKAYYENPRQMPEVHLKKLESLIGENCDKCSNKKCKLYIKDKHITNIHFNSDEFETINFSEVKELLEVLKLTDDKVTSVVDKLDLKDKIDYNMLESHKQDYKDLRCYLEHHYSYLKVICDYISEMTDNYAESEYEELYN